MSDPGDAASPEGERPEGERPEEEHPGGERPEADPGGDRADFERRLDELREEAAAGRERHPDFSVAGGPLPPSRRRAGTRSAPDVGADRPGGTDDLEPPEPLEGPPARDVASGRDGTDGAAGYYGMPIVKPPVWTWEVPAYFFVGGTAGMSGVIGAAALLADDDPRLARAACRIAAAGAPLSAALLVSDLGRPERFLYMLRVFKWRSPMSVGAWLLTAFGGFASLTVLWLERRFRELPSRAESAGKARGHADAVLATLATGTAATGAGLATYTGVLVGATAIPSWHAHRRTLPLHFGVAGLGSAAAVLEILGFRRPALHGLGFAAAAAEWAITASLERGPAARDRALHEGRAGRLLGTAGLLAGAVSLGLRALGCRRLAGLSFLAGSLLSRFGWLEAGRASARDPEALLEEQRGRP